MSSRRPGDALLRAVRERMPHYPIDAVFIRQLPSELGGLPSVLPVTLPETAEQNAAR